MIIVAIIWAGFFFITGQVSEISIIICGHIKISHLSSTRISSHLKKKSSMSMVEMLQAGEPQIFKLQLGALIPRSVGLRSICPGIMLEVP